jgi:hypothetical protein
LSVGAKAPTSITNDAGRALAEANTRPDVCTPDLTGEGAGGYA